MSPSITPECKAVSHQTSCEQPLLPCLQLSTTVLIETVEDRVFRPRLKKARAVLAMIALGDNYSVSRQRLAATLWSDGEKSVGFSRVRDLLHRLRSELNTACLDILVTTNTAVFFRPGSIKVNTDMSIIAGSVSLDRWSAYLMDLDGIDPALDRWLTQTRAIRRRENQLSKVAASVQEPEPSARIKDQPTVVVTELELGDSTTDVRLARALTDEIGSSLCKFRWFRTVTRSKNGGRVHIGVEDLSTIGDYALVGVLQSGISRSRLLLKMIDLRDEAIIWSSHFNEDQPFTVSVQQSFANAAAARLDTELLLVEIKRRRNMLGQSDSGSYSLVLQAVPAIYRLERDQFLDAGHILDEAVTTEKDSAFALSWLAYWHIFLVGQGWAVNVSRSMSSASRAAERASILDPQDARAITILGHVKAFLGGKLEEAASLHDLAIQLNPALALAWHLSGMTNAYAGRLDEASRCLSQCRQLAPTDPLGFFAEGALGIVYLLRKDHEAAVALGRRVTERQPNFTSAFKSYLSALGHLGKQAEAREVLGRLLVLEPRFSLTRFRSTAPYRHLEHLEHYLRGLRLAGVT